MKGRTEYSSDIAGTWTNHDLTVRFDMTDGVLGISQWVGKEIKNVDRVLLSKEQVKALLKFIGSGRNPLPEPK
jgi:hypothetical protein